jgi:hypothetical protein
MQRCELKIGLEKTEPTYLRGERLDGSVRVRMLESSRCRRLRLRLVHPAPAASGAEALRTPLWTLAANQVWAKGDEYLFGFSVPELMGWFGASGEHCETSVELEAAAEMDGCDEEEAVRIALRVVAPAEELPAPVRRPRARKRRASPPAPIGAAFAVAALFVALGIAGAWSAGLGAGLFGLAAGLGWLSLRRRALGLAPGRSLPDGLGPASAAVVAASGASRLRTHAPRLPAAFVPPKRA